RLQLRGLADAVCKCLREQPVREPRVARKERTVQVRSDGTTDATAFPAALAVVPESCHHAAQRRGARVEPRAPRVILEPGECSPDARLEVALEQHVSDHPSLAGDGLEWKEPDPRQLDAAQVAVETAAQPGTAADR